MDLEKIANNYVNRFHAFDLEQNRLMLADIFRRIKYKAEKDAIVQMIKAIPEDLYSEDARSIDEV